MDTSASVTDGSQQSVPGDETHSPDLLSQQRSEEAAPSKHGRNTTISHHDASSQTSASRQLKQLSRGLVSSKDPGLISANPQTPGTEAEPHQAADYEHELPASEPGITNLQSLSAAPEKMGQSSPSLGHVSINVSTIGHGPMQAAPTAAAAIAAEAAAAAANLHWMILCTGHCTLI